MIGSFGGFDFLFTLAPLFVAAVFVVVIVGMFANGARYLKNAAAPRETVYARVVAKRMDVRLYRHHHPTGEHMHMTNSSRTHYFITLEFENGERREYLDAKGLYGLVVEGDEGYAAVQGDWIVAFERRVSPST
jgi:hypothetical protein